MRCLPALALLVIMTLAPSLLWAQDPPPPPPPPPGADTGEETPPPPPPPKDDKDDQDGATPKAPKADDKSAEEGDPPPPPKIAGEDTRATPSKENASAAAADVPWRLLSQAFEAELRRERGESLSLLRSLVARYPTHPAAKRARQLIKVMEEQGSSLSKTVTVLGRNGEPIDGLARAELALFQTISGIGIGAELCIIAECDGPEPVISSLMVGGASGLAISLYLSRGGITSAQALAANSGASWGLWTALAAVQIFEELDIDLNNQSGGALVLSLQALGTGAGLLAYELLLPTVGAASLYNSAGIWGGLLTLFTSLAVDADLQTGATFGLVLATSHLAAVGGALLSRQLDNLSRGRVLLLDAGGILGVLFGMGSATLLGGDDGVFYGAATLLGLAGLGTSFYLTRDWDKPDASAGLQGSLMLAPTREGAWTLGYGGRF